MDILKSSISKIKDKLTKTELQRKLKEATSNEHCHANVSLLDEISSKTSNYADFQVIVQHCMKKLETKKENWRKILKTLFLIEHILKTGSPNFYDAMRSEIYKLKNLQSFSFIDTNRSDKGETIREKSKVIVGLLNDKAKWKEERENYAKWKGRIEGVSSGGKVNGSSFGSTSYGNYGNSVSSSSYVGSVSSSSYVDKGSHKSKKKKEESSSSSSGDSEDEKEKKKKHKKKKHKKQNEESDSSEEEEEKEKNTKKKQASKESEVTEKKKIAATSNISIKKPGAGNAGTTGNTSTSTNMIDPFEFSSSQKQAANTTTSNSNAFEDIFGGQSASSTVQPKKDAFNDIFNNPPQNQGNSNSMIDWSASSTTTLGGNNPMVSSTNPGQNKMDTQKLLNDMYNPSPNTNKPFEAQFGGMNLGGGSNMGNNMGNNMQGFQPGMPNPYMGMGMNQGMYQGMNQGLNQGMYPGTNQGMYPGSNQGMQTNPYMGGFGNMPGMNFGMNYGGNPGMNQNFSFPTENKSTNAKTNFKSTVNNDDDFKEVEEEDSFKFGDNSKKTGLNSLLDNKNLVNLGDLKSGNKSGGHTQSNTNFNFPY